MSTTIQLLPNGYSFVDTPPHLETYLSLRRLSGLSPKSPSQGIGALTGSWAFSTIAYTSPETNQPEIVAMSRLFGDGGWYFVVADMGVLPDHRRKGLAEAMLRRLLKKVETDAPPNALITLSADEMGRALYKKCGFVETAPLSIGMWLKPGDVSYTETSDEPNIRGLCTMKHHPSHATDYSFVDSPSPLKKYLSIRLLSRRSPRTPAQATRALAGSWAYCTISYTPSTGSPKVVGMSRVFGDGGWYFIIADMCVVPEHRRKGLGEAMLRLLLKIRTDAPPNAYISLAAKEIGLSLYKKCGFMESAPMSIGMHLKMGELQEKKIGLEGTT